MGYRGVFLLVLLIRCTNRQVIQVYSTLINWSLYRDLLPILNDHCITSRVLILNFIGRLYLI